MNLGRGARTRTEVTGFGGPRTSRCTTPLDMEEKKGFEPLGPVKALLFSRQTVSTSHALLHLHKTWDSNPSVPVYVYCKPGWV